MLRTTALALALLLLSSACGHYGPPLRAESPAPQGQAEAPPVDPEEDAEESEQP
jgi:hypothetical protein